MVRVMNERQEVAAKLRENSTAAHNAEEALRIICKCTIRTMKGSKGVMEVLADLIDPTCHVVICGQSDKYHVCKTCSECHFGWHEDIYDKDFSFCPNCGARVVSEDE